MWKRRIRKIKDKEESFIDYKGEENNEIDKELKNWRGRNQPVAIDFYLFGE